MNNTEPDAEGIVDSAVLFTLGVLSGGWALDMGNPQPRSRALRHSLIDLLLNSIKEGSFGPLRLVHRADGLYLTGCGFMHAVDSPEHAETVIAQLMKDLEPMLRGLDADVMLRLESFEDIDPAEESCPQDMAGTTDGYDAADDSDDLAWHDLIETIEPTCDLCPASTAGAAVTSEHTPAPADHKPVVETAQASIASVTDAPVVAPAAEAPPIATVSETPVKALPISSYLITLRPLKRPDRRPAIEQIDDKLDEIISRMHSRKSLV